MAYEVALPEEDIRGFGDYLDALKRRRKPAMLLAAAILFVGLIGIYLWPNTYRSMATILIEEPEVPPGLVPSTVTTYAARQVQYINQRVMTRTNLAQIIEKFNLFPEERKYVPTQMVVPDVQKDVRIDVVDVQTPGRESSQAVTTTIAFQVGFQHKNPATARAVANELVSLYLGENVRVRTEQTAQTTQFVEAEVDRLDKEVKEIESQIGAYKAQNQGALPQEAAMNQSVMQRADDELRDITRQLKANEGSTILLEAQLATIQPNSPRLLSDGRAVVAPSDQLKALQTQMTMLESRYSPDHPDVVRTRKDIEALQASIGDKVDLADNAGSFNQAQIDLAQAREHYGPDHPEVQRLEKLVASLQARKDSPKSHSSKLDPDNPAYIQIQAQLNTIKAGDAALKGKQQELRAQLVSMEKNLGQSSEVERALSEMGRKLGNTEMSYKIAREKLFAAKMGQSLETQSKGERFSLVEPPDLPLVPASPNRPFLLSMLVLLTLATGFGWPQVAETMDHTITGPRAVQRIQGVLPIAEIPRITTEADQKRQTRSNRTVFLLVPAVMVLIVVLVHFFLIPLDVVWYVGLRKLGL